MNRVHFEPIYRNPMIDRPDNTRHALTGNPALIILRGSGGSGKTVTAMQIVREYVTREAEAEAIWIRFGKGQTGVEQVWQHIFKHLLDAAILPEESIAPGLRQGGASSKQTIIDALASRQTPLMLVLDDGQHSISSDVEQSLLDVLEAVPTLSVLIATRRTLAGLVTQHARMRFHVRKLTHEHLYFQRHEIAELIQSRGLATTDPDSLAAWIFQQSQGWPLAVHALLVEQECLDASEFVPLDRQTTSSFFVKELVEQALAGADILSQQALCAVAMFGEVTATMLATILDIPAQQSHTLLTEHLDERLESWTDETGTSWYKLHDVVAEEFQHRVHSIVSRDELKRLARRAARVYTEVRPRLAIQAALIGEDWTLLSELMLTSDSFTLSRRQQVVSLADLPSEVREKYPVLATFALLHEYAFPSGRLGKMLHSFKLLTSRQLVNESRKLGVTGLTAAILRMVIARLIGSEKSALSMAQLAHGKMQYLSQQEVREYSAPLQVGINQVAITYLHAGLFTEAIELLEPMWSRREGLQPKSKAHAASLLAWAHAFQGDIAVARLWVERCEEMYMPLDWKFTYIGAGYRIAAALCELEAGQPEQAQGHIQALAEHEDTIEHWPFLAYVKTLVLESELGATAAVSALDARLSRKNIRMTDSMQSMLNSLKARLVWQSGKVLPPARKRDVFDVAAVYAKISRGNITRAAAFVAELDSRPDINEQPRAHAEVVLLRAEIARRLKEPHGAREHASRAAAIMHEYGLTLPMRAISRDAALALQQLVPELPSEYAIAKNVQSRRALTPAEERTLVAVLEHGTAKAAAQALFISQDTVKGHLKQVYRKLGVNNREDAARVASETGIFHGLGSSHA